MNGVQLPLKAGVFILLLSDIQRLNLLVLFLDISLCQHTILQVVEAVSDGNHIDYLELITNLFKQIADDLLVEIELNRIANHIDILKRSELLYSLDIFHLLDHVVD